jgi:hypothetical protein
MAGDVLVGFEALLRDADAGHVLHEALDDAVGVAQRDWDVRLQIGREVGRGEATGWTESHWLTTMRKRARRKSVPVHRVDVDQPGDSSASGATRTGNDLPVSVSVPAAWSPSFGLSGVRSADAVMR